MIVDEIELLPMLAPKNVTANENSLPIDLQAEDANEICVLVQTGAISSTPSLVVQLQDSPALVRGLDDAALSGATETILRNATNDNVELAKKFTQAGARTIKAVSLLLKKFGTVTAGTKVTCSIQADNAGVPSGTPLVSADALTDTLSSTGYSWVRFDFATPLELANATVYHVVLSGDYTLSTSNMVKWRSKTVASGGDQLIKDSAYGAVVATEKMEAFTEQYEFADIAGAALAALTAAGQVRRLGLRGSAVRRHLRAKLTISGGQVITGIMGMTTAGRRPVTAQG